MAVLEDIPDDFLLEVISNIRRSSDFNSLMLVSHRLHKLVLGSSSLFLSMMYRSLNFGDGAPYLRSLLYATLCSILNVPERALYVETFTIEWDPPSRDDYFEFEFDDVTDLMESFVKQRGIYEWKRGEVFVCALRLGNQEAHVALLLLLLGNMEILRIFINVEDEWVPWAIQNVASTCLLRPGLFSGLHSLRDVKINCDLGCRDWLYTISLKDIAPLLLLPSIDKIEVEYVFHTNSFIDNNDVVFWKQKYGTSSVTKLSLDISAINLEALEEILSIPKELRSFYYGYLIDDWNEEDELDYDGIRAEILKFRRRMQESLPDCDIQIAEYGNEDP